MIGRIIWGFIIPSPALLSGLMAISFEDFNYYGIDKWTMAIPMFIIYIIGVFYYFLRIPIEDGDKK